MEENLQARKLPCCFTMLEIVLVKALSHCDFSNSNFLSARMS